MLITHAIHTCLSLSLRGSKQREPTREGFWRIRGYLGKYLGKIFPSSKIMRQRTQRAADIDHSPWALRVCCILQSGFGMLLGCSRLVPTLSLFGKSLCGNTDCGLLFLFSRNKNSFHHAPGAKSVSQPFWVHPAWGTKDCPWISTIQHIYCIMPPGRKLFLKPFG